MPTDLPALEQSATKELRELFRTQEKYVRVHAAESLLKFGHPEGIYDQFKKEWEAHQNDTGYRVVIMRVLSRTSPTPAEREQWSQRIRDVFADPAQPPDRLHAIECLAKLGYHVQPADRPLFDENKSNKSLGIAVLTCWTLSFTDYTAHERILIEYLRNADWTARYNAAYALRQLSTISDEAKAAVRKAAQAEQPGTLAFAYLNSASLVLSTPGDAKEAVRARGELTKLAATGDLDEDREIAAAFGVAGNVEDVPVLKTLLANDNPDIREAAAHALISIARRARNAP